MARALRQGAQLSQHLQKTSWFASRSPKAYNWSHYRDYEVPTRSLVLRFVEGESYCGN